MRRGRPPGFGEGAVFAVRSWRISVGKELIRTHPIRHDRTREHGALANPGGRPRRINAA